MSEITEYGTYVRFTVPHMTSVGHMERERNQRVIEIAESSKEQDVSWEYHIVQEKRVSTTKIGIVSSGLVKLS